MSTSAASAVNTVNNAKIKDQQEPASKDIADIVEGVLKEMVNMMVNWNHQVQDALGAYSQWARGVALWFEWAFYAVLGLVVVGIGSVVLIYPQISMPIIFMLGIYVYILKYFSLVQCESLLQNSNEVITNLRDRAHLVNGEAFFQRNEEEFTRQLIEEKNSENQQNLKMRYFSYLTNSHNPPNRATFDINFISAEIEQDQFLRDYFCCYTLKLAQFPVYCTLNNKYYDAAHVYYYLYVNGTLPQVGSKPGGSSYTFAELKKSLHFDEGRFFDIQRRLEAIYELKMIMPLKEKIRKASQKIL